MMVCDYPSTIDICALSIALHCVATAESKSNLMCDDPVRSLQATSVVLGGAVKHQCQTWAFPRTVRWLFAVRQCCTFLLEGRAVLDLGGMWDGEVGLRRR